MSCGTTAVKFLLRRSTAAEWVKSNPTLRAGEPGFESDNYLLKIGDGVNAWNDLPYTVGSTGDTGPQGDAGAAGAVGASGLKGDQGIQGQKGDQGVKGDQGIQGSQGLQGVAGPRGLQGNPGLQGEAGPAGAKGDPGDPGAVLWDGWGYTGTTPVTSGFFTTSPAPPAMNSLTSLSFHKVSGNNTDWSTTLNYTGAGSVFELSGASGANIYSTWYVTTADSSLSGNVFTLPVSYLKGDTTWQPINPTVYGYPAGRSPSYTANPSHWVSPVPTTLSQAVSRIAAVLAQSAPIP